MKHSLILSLCVACLAAFGISSAQAAIDVSLNLRYTDPADPSEGGTWTLVAVASGNDGIAGLAAHLDPNTITGLDVSASVIGNGNSAINGLPATTNLDLGHEILGGNLGILTDPNDGYFELLYGQDPNDGVVTGVGAGTASIGPDPLFNSAWDGASIIASGVFGSTRPAFSSILEGEANEIETGTGNIVECAVGGCLTFTVRGDSLDTLGLESPVGAGLQAGDLNRDGAVGPSDLGTLGANWDPAGTTNGWEDGDINGDGAVGPSDLGTLGANWDPAGSNTIPPVPEPASAALLILGSFLGLGIRRR